MIDLDAIDWPDVIRVITPGPPGQPGGAIVMTGPAVLGREAGTGAPVQLPLAAGLRVVGGSLALAEGMGTVTLSMPTGFTVAGSGSNALAVSFAAGYSLPTTTKQGQWDAAYSERLQWDGSGAGLDPSAGRASLGLGTAATTDATAYATAAQGTDAREWIASTATQIEAEAGTSTERLAWSPVRVWQAAAAWWAQSAAALKLAGIAAGATANSPDATLLNRENHTGTQPASTITGLGTAATTDATAYATAAQGTDAREWIAATVEQAEAEAGVATTRRAWTAERVRQAAAAWFIGSGNQYDGYVNGNWVMPLRGSFATSTALTANAIHAVPFRVLQQVRIDGLAARVVNTSAGASIQLAIYASAGNGLGSLLTNSASLSAGAATTVSDETVSTALLLPGRLYWWAVNTNGTPALQALATGFTVAGDIIGAPSLTFLSNTSTAFGAVRQYNVAFETWPADLSSTPPLYQTANRFSLPMFHISGFS